MKFLLPTLLCFSLFILHGANFPRVFGLVSFYSFLVVIVILVALRILSSKSIKLGPVAIFAFLISMAFLYLIFAFVQSDVISLFERVIQLIVVVLMVWVCFDAASRYSKFSAIMAYQAVFFASALFLIAGAYSYSSFSASQETILGFGNNNLVGMWIAISSLIGLPLLKNKFYAGIFMLVAFYAVYITGARASLVGLFVALLIGHLWPLITKTLYGYWATIISILGAIFLVIFIFSFESIDLGVYSAISRDFSGKNIYSGREILWPELIRLGLERPIIGRGAGSLNADVTGFSLSAHNHFIQTFFEAGISGLLLLIVVILCVWRYCWLHRQSKYMASGASVFVFVLTIQTFEVTLLQNNLVLSLPMWGYLGHCYGWDSGRSRIAAKAI